MSYDDYGEEGDVDDIEQGAIGLEYDGRTRLDKTIDRIGMGWLADNMWIQAIAIILPRVQQHYSVPDNYIGALSSSMFAGMMLGAVGWGTCSDVLGRSTAFNATLFFTSVFGMLASLASSFWTLCLLLFLLGSAVGGSLPTDGTLLLEHMPKDKQYLVTALSVFFSIGSVVSALVGLIVMPGHSCLPNQPCDPSTDNRGWQYMVITLGLITLSMFLARIVFFRLHESPRYLVHAGRHQEALENLQLISRFNGSELTLVLDDVDDCHPPEPPPEINGLATSDERVPFLPPSSVSETSTHPAAVADGDVPAGNGATPVELTRDEGMKGYRSTDESSNTLECHSFFTPVEELPPLGHNPVRGDVDVRPSRAPTQTVAHVESKRRRSVLPRRHSRERRSRSRTSSIVMVERIGLRCKGALTRWMDRIRLVLSPEWFRTTVLVWGAWSFLTLAYTMFNVFFPKLLETGSSGEQLSRSLEDNLWDVVIFTLGGCPGAILGAYLVESSLGRRGSLAGMIILTAICCFLFVHVSGPLSIRLSSLGISLFSTAMYAILYGWTPEIFSTGVRGTACGIATALSRIGGMIAPLVGGALLVINRAFPVYASILVYMFGVTCVLLLRETPGQKGERSLAH
ncbi:major facilitator superfamily domain-containing protein [Pisolithus marmoratus]|nr:major facilitator superfamily domain-containing protein [Pisolithus marmoratus]